MRKFSKIFICLLLILTCFFVINVPVNADSGWDSDYSSGSSWDYDTGSSYDYDRGSSRYDYGSSSGGSYHSGGSSSSDPVTVMFALIFLIIVLCVRLLVRSALNPPKKIKDPNVEINEIIQEHAGVWTADNIGDFVPGYDNDKLLKELYEKFVKIQEAWMEFDYDSLKKLCTDELYESYKSDLEILESQNGKNIMDDFDLVTSRIVDVKKVEDRVAVTIFLQVRFHDYVINTKDNSVTRGNKKTIMNNKYSLEFVVDVAENNVCPSCGAKLDSRDCPYCGSHVDVSSDEFILSKKERIR